MSAKTLTIALVQSDPVWHEPQANLARAETAVHEAARQGARLVVLPEMFSTGFTMEPDRFAEAVPGPTQARLAEVARAAGVYLVGTGIEAHSPKPRNVAFALSPGGELLATYRKIHPFSYGQESLHYVGGGGAGELLFEVDGVRCGLQICYDLRFPEPFRALASAGAEVVVVPANWPVRRVRHWSALLVARAIENQMIVAGVNRVGRDPNVDYPGASAIIDEQGDTVAQGGDREELVVGTVDLDALRAWRERFPALRDRRPDVYAALDEALSG